MKINLKQLAVQTLDQTGNLLLSPPYGGFGYYRNHGPRATRQVALTFDDGPSKPCTEELLNMLDDLEVNATFFWVGANVMSHPDLVVRADAAHHIIANHSMEHSRKSGLILQDDGHFTDAEEVVYKVLGKRTRLYRPPWGWLPPWEGHRLNRIGYTVIGWDVYTLDWQLPEPDGRWMAEDAAERTQPGSIFCFHDGRAHAPVWNKKQTIRAIQHLVPLLRAKGYTFVTVPQLLNVPGYA